MEFQVIASSGEVRYRHGGILGDRKKKNQHLVQIA